jgi:hypothetical protein
MVMMTLDVSALAVLYTTLLAGLRMGGAVAGIAAMVVVFEWGRGR